MCIFEIAADAAARKALSNAHVFLAFFIYCNHNVRGCRHQTISLQACKHRALSHHPPTPCSDQLVPFVHGLAHFLAGEAQSPASPYAILHGRREPGRDGKILCDHRQDGNDEVHRL